MPEAIVIYQEIPDNLKIYKVTVDETDLGILKTCHNALIGEEIVESLGMWLLELLEANDPIYSMEGGLTEGWPVILNEFSGNIVVTGIML